MANSLNDLIKAKLISLGAIGITIPDLEKNYYSGLSGIAITNSIVDHKRSYYALTAGVSGIGRSLTDLEFAYWAFVNGANIFGSRDDRARIFYA